MTHLQPTVPSPPGGADRLWASVVGGDVSFLLARANFFSISKVNAALAPFGLKARSLSVLAIAASELRPSQRELADFLCLDARQIMLIVDDLECRGWVTREPAPADRRINIVVATTEGRRVHDEARASATAAGNELMSTVAASDFDRLSRALRALATPPREP
ncbi:MarR family winged helix-turn-helix transcriptional regulator [Microbacterium sp.]|uniref:MarR family winged helix-turn-helix transcriptional regulator n=1 Tax=Microbacterium sp. TaxID=51671 RepID=UPI003A87829C